MNIAICDDQKNFREQLENQLTNYYANTNISINICHFSSGEELISATTLFDLIFLDIQMKEVNGIDAGRELKSRNPYSIIFIITSYNGYLDDAFKINAFRFLSKPLDVLRLYKALDDAAELINNEIIVFHDMASKENMRIHANDIILVEIEKKKTKIVTVNGTHYSSENIAFWRNKLNGISFVCPHASYITNLDHSIRHSRTELILARKDREGNIVEKFSVSIAPKRQAEIKRLFFYVFERR